MRNTKLNKLRNRMTRSRERFHRLYGAKDEYRIGWPKVTGNEPWNTFLVDLKRRHGDIGFEAVPSIWFENLIYTHHADDRVKDREMEDIVKNLQNNFKLPMVRVPELGDDGEKIYKVFTREGDFIVDGSGVFITMYKTTTYQGAQTRKKQKTEQHFKRKQGEKEKSIQKEKRTQHLKKKKKQGSISKQDHKSDSVHELKRKWSSRGGGRGRGGRGGRGRGNKGGGGRGRGKKG